MSKNDEKIKKLMGAVEDKKKAMGSRPKVSFETAALFKFPDGSSFNLNVVAETDILVNALSTLLITQTATENAAEMLGLDSPPEMEWQGYKVSEWAGDFKQRIRAIQWNEEKKKLTALEKKLAKLISEDARTAMELENIENMLK